MTHDPIKGIGPVPGPGEGQGGSSPRPGETEFRRILEQLEQLSRPGPEKTGEPDPDDFARELRKAEDDYMSVMDLRRRLEEAFRRSQP